MTSRAGSARISDQGGSKASSKAENSTSQADAENSSNPGVIDQLLARSVARSKGQIQIGRQKLAYKTLAEFLPVFGSELADHGKPPQAAVLTTAYIVESSRGSSRPVCFAFNGGPGSSSVWLHFGALGPKRVAINEDGSAPPPPYGVVDNPDTWLDWADLVFIDPPHTGWSASRDEEARRKHFSVDGDVELMTEVIRRWLTQNRRWSSSVYLAGESYGTTRGAALADSLSGVGVTLKGLILVSCAMDLQTLVFAPGNHLPYALFLPGFANTSQYHGLLSGALGKSSEAARQAAEEFVAHDYVSALQAGHRLSPKSFASIARRIAELTGLNAQLIEQHNLRISDKTYFMEAMRSQGRFIGRLESRVTGPLPASGSREWEFDPGIDALAGPYTMAAQHYFADSLGLDLPERYKTLNYEVNKAWKWNRGQQQGNQFCNTLPDLARAMRRNPHLKVWVASGRYDLGTPYSATDYCLAQLDVPAGLLKRITHTYYDAGHMMYTRSEDLRRLKIDLKAWLKGL